MQQGVRFDPDLPQTIRLEFAKSNTKVSKPKQPQAGQPGMPGAPGSIPVSSASSAAAAARSEKGALASELIALIVSQEKVGLGTSYSDTLRMKRGMWFSGATKLGPWPLKERSTSEQHCIGVIKLRVKGNNFAGIGSAK